MSNVRPTTFTSTAPPQTRLAINQPLCRLTPPSRPVVSLHPTTMLVSTPTTIQLQPGTPAMSTRPGKQKCTFQKIVLKHSGITKSAVICIMSSIIGLYLIPLAQIWQWNVEGRVGCEKLGAVSFHRSGNAIFGQIICFINYAPKSCYRIKYSIALINLINWDRTPSGLS